MQLNKQLISIIILVSLLVSAIAVAFYFYKKQQDTLKAKSEMVTIYIAKDDIAKDTLLKVEHLAQTQIEKQYVLNKPLLKSEILGKYTNERIYKHEIFLKQKLDTKVVKEKKKILPFKHSSYNMKFKLFKNPNYALHQGEYINIVSVFPKGQPDKKGRYLDYDVNYVAPNIKILGFIRNGRYESQTITKHKLKKVVNKKKVDVVEEVKADEIILDIELNVLLKLIKNYNLGTQLWMTKTNFVEKPQPKNIEVSKAQAVSKKVKPVKKVYAYKMFKPTQKSIHRKAVIEYGNDKDKSKSKSKEVTLAVDKRKICASIKDKFIVGVTPSFNIRTSPSTSSKGKEILHKNTIIPYIFKTGNWYKTCDDRFVHHSVVNPMSPKQVKKKLAKNGK